MIKTTYQTPELRDANDNVVQEGAFGKNTALSNAENTGWIDYVMNDLEALHDTIGDSAPTLDGNGHVVEPANLAIGDEDGLRIKNNYLKLSGGNVAGTLNVQQNLKFQDNQENVFGGVYVPSSSATEQYAQFYGGEGTGVAGAKLTLYPDGDGRFKLDARSTDGANTYTLVTDNSGNLNWRGYPLAWKKDYLPLAGGTMTGAITLNNGVGTLLSYSNGTYLSGNGNDSNASKLVLYTNEDGSGVLIDAGNGKTRSRLLCKPDGTFTWNDNTIALAKNYLPLTGGTMTGILSFNANEGRIRNIKSENDGYIGIYGGAGYTTGAYLVLNGKDRSSNGGGFELYARNDADGVKVLYAKPDGTLRWANKNVERVNSSGTNYIRYENGLQICWRSGANFDTNGTQIVLPVPFKDATYAVNVTGRGLTTSTNIGILKVTTKDSAGFVAMAVETSNISSFAGGTADYIAIGLWK